MNLATLLPHPFLQAGVGGILIGLASWLLLASLGRIAGISGIAAGALVPTHGAAAGERAWRWAFVAGLVLVGAGAAALLHMPVMATRPLPLLIVAGLLVGFGTVMGGALLVTLIAYAVTPRKGNKPWFAPRFELPTRQDIELRLVGGATLFGMGWGLAGYCPGPALASLLSGGLDVLAFVAALAVGMWVAKRFTA